MIARQSSAIEFVEIAVPLGKIDAGPVVQALLETKPGRHLLVAVRGGPRQVRTRRRVARLFRDRPVVNLLGGEPEYLDPLKDEARWLVRHRLSLVGHRHARA